MELVIHTFGTSVSRDGNGFVITNQQGRKRLPADGLRSIQIGKGVQITSDAILLAIEYEIEVLFIERSGKPAGRVWSPKYGSISTIRKGQLAFVSSPQATDWVKDVICKKILNQQALLLTMRIADSSEKHEVDKVISRLEEYIRKVHLLEGTYVSDVASTLRGWEGVSSRIYFNAMNYFIRFAGCDNEGNQLEGSPMKGGLIVAAAGNDGQTIKHYPAAYEPVIAVSSYGPQMKAAWYTCRGSWVDICGPGGDAMYQGANGDILSAVKPSANNAGESYLTKFGTSQASPYVAGIAALVVSAKGGKGFTNEDCKARILNALRPFDINEQNPTLKNTLGRGYIDAARALDDNQHKRPASTELTLRTLYNQIILSWKISADEDDGMANTYRIYYSEKAFAATDLAQAIPAGSSNVSAASELRYIEVFTGVRKAGETYTFTLDRLKVNQHYYLAIMPVDRWG